MVDRVGLLQHRQIAGISAAVADVAERASHVGFPQADNPTVVAPEPHFLDALLLDPLRDADPFHDLVVVGHRGTFAGVGDGGQWLQELEGLHHPVGKTGLGLLVFVAVVP